MSGGSIGKIAGIALPIAAGVFAPELLPALGFAATAGTTAALTGVAGAAGGLISGGGLKGAAIGGALGAAGGYLGTPGNAVQDSAISGLNNAGFGNAAYNASEAEDAGSGLFGSAAAAASGGTLGAAGAAAGGGSSLLSKATSIAPLLASGVQYLSGQNAISAEKQAESTQAANLAPYNAAGKTALTDYNNLLDPNNQASFIQNNPLYTSLADDATRRLNATAAANGKFGTGGTANALQEQLLNLGNGLVQQRLGNDSSLIQGGQSAAAGTGVGALTAAGTIGGVQQGQGNAVASGIVGATNTGNAQYQNSINTLLALQNLKNSNIPQAKVPALNL